jgi:hypothetical protein
MPNMASGRRDGPFEPIAAVRSIQERDRLGVEAHVPNGARVLDPPHRLDRDGGAGEVDLVSRRPA